MADAAAPTPDADQQPGEPTAAAEASATTNTPEAPAEPAAPEPTPLAAAPEPEPEPVSAPEPEPAPMPEVPAVPTVATTIEVPALERPPAAAPDGEGGEWELLVEKVRQWLASGQLQELWQTARTPLSAVAVLVAVLLVLRIYGALLGVLDSLPLVPGLLELVGVISVVRFGLTRLVRSSDRRQVIADLKGRWAAFRGQG